MHTNNKSNKDYHTKPRLTNKEGFISFEEAVETGVFFSNGNNDEDLSVIESLIGINPNNPENQNIELINNFFTTNKNKPNIEKDYLKLANNTIIAKPRKTYADCLVKNPNSEHTKLYLQSFNKYARSYKPKPNYNNYHRCLSIISRMFNSAAQKEFFLSEDPEHQRITELYFLTFAALLSGFLIDNNYVYKVEKLDQALQGNVESYINVMYNNAFILNFYNEIEEAIETLKNQINQPTLGITKDLLAIIKLFHLVTTSYPYITKTTPTKANEICEIIFNKKNEFNSPEDWLKHTSLEYYGTKAPTVYLRPKDQLRKFSILKCDERCSNEDTSDEKMRKHVLSSALMLTLDICKPEDLNKTKLYGFKYNSQIAASKAEKEKQIEKYRNTGVDQLLSNINDNTNTHKNKSQKNKKQTPDKKAASLKQSIRDTINKNPFILQNIKDNLDLSNLLKLLNTPRKIKKKTALNRAIKIFEEFKSLSDLQKNPTEIKGKQRLDNLINYLGEDFINEANIHVYGGFLRDTLLGLEPNDFDLGSQLKSQEIENLLNKHGIKFKKSDKYENRFFIKIPKNENIQDDILTIEASINPEDNDSLQINSLFMNLPKYISNGRILKSELIQAKGKISKKCKYAKVDFVGLFYNALKAPSADWHDKARVLRHIYTAAKLNTGLNLNFTQNINKICLQITKSGKNTRIPPLAFCNKLLSIIKQDHEFFFNTLENNPDLYKLLFDISVHNYYKELFTFIKNNEELKTKGNLATSTLMVGLTLPNYKRVNAKVDFDLHDALKTTLLYDPNAFRYSGHEKLIQIYSIASIDFKAASKFIQDGIKKFEDKDYLKTICEIYKKDPVAKPATLNNRNTLWQQESSNPSSGDRHTSHYNGI